MALLHVPTKGARVVELLLAKLTLPLWLPVRATGHAHQDRCKFVFPASNPRTTA